MARPGWPRVDPQTLATTAPGVFVAGDLAHGTRLLIDAVASGKATPRAIGFVTGHVLHASSLTSHLPLAGYHRELGYESIRRQPVPLREPADRLGDPDATVEVGCTEEQARREASRCLDCGVTPVFDGTRCVLCGGCADVCPTRVPETGAAQRHRRDGGRGRTRRPHARTRRRPDGQLAIVKDEDRCIRCALCVMRCPTDAIAMERVAVSTCWRVS